MFMPVRMILRLSESDKNKHSLIFLNDLHVSRNSQLLVKQHPHLEIFNVVIVSFVIVMNTSRGKATAAAGSKSEKWPAAGQGNHGRKRSSQFQNPGLLPYERRVEKKFKDPYLRRQPRDVKRQRKCAFPQFSKHPGAILDQVEAKLKLTHDKMQGSRDVLSEHGNMPSSSVPFFLDQIRQRSLKMGASTTGGGHEFGFSIGFGTGLTLETLVLRSVPIIA